MGEEESGGSVERKDVYSSKRKELVLVSLLDSYSKLKAISISVGKLFSCFTSHYIDYLSY